MSACVESDERARRRRPAGKRVEVELSRSYFGTSDTPERYVIVTIPPAPNPSPERGRVTREAGRWGSRLAAISVFAGPPPDRFAIDLPFQGGKQRSSVSQYR